MKRKISIIIAILVVLSIGAGTAYLLRHRPATPHPPVTPQISQEQLQAGLKDMLTRKAELRSLKTQLAVYEKLLRQLPGNPEVSRRAEELRRRISELE